MKVSRTDRFNSRFSIIEYKRHPYLFLSKPTESEITNVVLVWIPSVVSKALLEGNSMSMGNLYSLEHGAKCNSTRSKKAAKSAKL